jgi:exosortase A
VAAPQAQADSRVAIIPWIAAVFGLDLVIYRNTWLSMLDIWLRSDTFSHCLLVFPISIFLIWRQRSDLRSVEIRPSFWGVALLASLSVVWWLSMAMGLQIGMHAAVVAMLPTVVLAFCGFPLVSRLIFPLAFLGFAVPFGEFVIPELVDITAALTTNTLQAFGIPVIREGQFFEVPSGSYSIAQACAGLNYFIATLALAALIANAYFRGWRKRVLFVVAAAIFSVAANCVRATTIVLIMHFSDVDISAAKDHEFVGWLAYLLLLIVLLGVASWLSDTHNPDDSGAILKGEAVKAAGGQVGPWRNLAMAAVCAVTIGSGTALASFSTSGPAGGQSIGSLPPVPGWQYQPTVIADVRPNFTGFTKQMSATYTRHGQTIFATVFRYSGFAQGAEMINAAHSVLPFDQWRINLPSIHEPGDGWPPTVMQTIGRPRTGPLPMLVWYWYEVNDQVTISAFDVKWMEAKNFLTFSPNTSTAIIITAPILRSLEETQSVMREFLESTESTSMNCAVESRHDDCLLTNARREP